VQRVEQLDSLRDAEEVAHRRERIVTFVTAALVVRRAGISGVQTDLRIEAGRISAIDSGLRRAPGELELDAVGGDVLPGLHDHHLHLLALAAAGRSVRAGPPWVRDRPAFATALSQAAAGRPPGQWIRAVGYHESVAGELDRDILDRIVPRHPLRVQHRSGALWICNSAGLDVLDVDAVIVSGIERDPTGRASGRLWRMDAWLGERLRSISPESISLARLSVAAAAMGITGWTDATPERPDRDTDVLLEAVASGEVKQRLHLMVPSTAADASVARMRAVGVTAGAVKVLLDDPTLPLLGELAEVFGLAHDGGRPVAVHCVTRVQLLLTLAALDMSGVLPGDRIEHGAVIPAEVLSRLAAWGLTVVTQPNFVAERGDQYLEEVPPSDLPDLWRGRSLGDAGVVTAAGTDAPFGSYDPWLAIRAAVRRRTLSGRELGRAEAVSPETAVGWWLGSAMFPGRPRRLVPGQPADLVILRAPLADAIAGDGPVPVVGTVMGGAVIWQQGA
jgi:predicted amidohydrolase YtcJ